MKFTISKELLKTLVDIQDGLGRDNLFVYLLHEGIGWRVHNQSTTAMAGGSLASGAFVSFDSGVGPDDNSELALALDIDKVKDFLKLAKKDISVSEDENKRIVFESGPLGGRIARIDTATILKPNKPKVPYSASFDIAAEDFRTGLSVSATRKSLGRPDCKITIADGAVRFASDKTNAEDIYVNFGSETVSNLVTAGPVSVAYPLEQLQGGVRAIPSEMLHVSTGSDLPMQIEYTFADGKGHGWFITAPLIGE